MAEQTYEYLILRLSGDRAAHLAERLNQHAAEGYEPIMMCGDAALSLLLRRPKEAKLEPPEEAV
ncbi:MAG: hypothetical protein FJX74_11010 [Armatimonadetes bacterium]|nr:hypothetical protein [Armatimonadota bacterium]